jgi:hypothetical protein
MWCLELRVFQFSLNVSLHYEIQRYIERLLLGIHR